jgi:hypothetical protein
MKPDDTQDDQGAICAQCGQPIPPGTQFVWSPPFPTGIPDEWIRYPWHLACAAKHGKNATPIA